MSKYFDINMLDDYLDLGLRFRVFVDGEYLNVNDPNDLLTNYKATGYTQKGEPVEFEYMDIDHVSIGSNIFTKDELNGLDKKKSTQDSETDQGEPEETGEESGAETTDTEDQGGPEGGPEGETRPAQEDETDKESTE